MNLMWSNHMELARAEPNPVFQITSYRYLPVFHTRRDLREDHVFFLEGRVALSDLGNVLGV